MIMKKYFIFAALVTAGMLTSCSSSDDAISETPNVPTSNESDLVAIKIGVAKPTANITRGTGTVGGVVNGSSVAVNNDGTLAGAPANSWAGQKVNVFMFKRDQDANNEYTIKTLDLAKFDGTDIYNDAVLTTPKAAATGIADYLVPDDATGLPAAADPTAQTGVNNPKQERYVKYYPMNGSFDFWGYRVDVANPATDVAIAKNATEDVMSATFDIDGTQDVLGGTTVFKAYTALTDGEKTAMGVTSSDEYDAYRQKRFYSASSARAGFQPELSFKHMLTRLTFEAYAGDDNAKETTTGGDYLGVYVRGIDVRAIDDIVAVNDTNYISPENVVFDIAGTDGAFEQKVTFETIDGIDKTPAKQALKPTPFSLKTRPSYKHATNGTVISAAAWNLLDGSEKSNYTAITDANKPAENLVPILAGDDNTAPNQNGSISLATTTTDGVTKVQIGEAVIAPSAKAYELTIYLCQKVVKTEDGTDAGHPSDAIRYENIKFNTIKAVVYATEKSKTGAEIDATKDVFQAGFSYNFRIKVYGLERIDITTTLNPWTYGGGVDVNTDN